MNLNWKMPTWKGLVGLVSLAAGVVTSLTAAPGTLPAGLEKYLIPVGAGLLAVERWADTVDNRVAQAQASATSIESTVRQVLAAAGINLSVPSTTTTESTPQPVTPAPVMPTVVSSVGAIAADPAGTQSTL